MVSDWDTGQKSSTQRLLRAESCEVFHIHTDIYPDPTFGLNRSAVLLKIFSFSLEIPLNNEDVYIDLSGGASVFDTRACQKTSSVVRASRFMRSFSEPVFSRGTNSRNFW